MTEAFAIFNKKIMSRKRIYLMTYYLRIFLLGTISTKISKNIKRKKTCYSHVTHLKKKNYMEQYLITCIIL
jgi:hypothetical protein